MTWAGVAIAGTIAGLFAAVMLFSRSLYVSAVALLVVLLQTGALYVLLGAPLLGLLQVGIYAGAVMVLAVITIMAVGGEPGPGFRRVAEFSYPGWAVGGVLAVAVGGAALVIALRSGPAAASISHPAANVDFAAVLFRPYALATEAVGLLMFLSALAILPDGEAS